MAQGVFEINEGGTVVQDRPQPGPALAQFLFRPLVGEDLGLQSRVGLGQFGGAQAHAQLEFVAGLAQGLLRLFAVGNVHHGHVDLRCGVESRALQHTDQFHHEPPAAAVKYLDLGAGLVLAASQPVEVSEKLPAVGLLGQRQERSADQPGPFAVQQFGAGQVDVANATIAIEGEIANGGDVVKVRVMLAGNLHLELRFPQRAPFLP